MKLVLLAYTSKPFLCSASFVLITLSIASSLHVDTKFAASNAVPTFQSVPYAPSNVLLSACTSRRANLDSIFVEESYLLMILLSKICNVKCSVVSPATMSFDAREVLSIKKYASFNRHRNEHEYLLDSFAFRAFRNDINSGL